MKYIPEAQLEKIAALPDLFMKQVMKIEKETDDDEESEQPSLHTSVSHLDINQLEEGA